MPGKTIGISLNLGFAGNVTRNPFNIIGNRKVKSILSGTVEQLSAIPFGAGTVLNEDGTVSLFGDTGAGVATPTAENFGGIAVAEVKQGTVYATEQSGAYLPTQACDVIQQGSVAIVLAMGDPVAGGQVYIVDDAGTSTAVVVGDFVDSATPDGDSTAIAVPGARFKTNKKDSNSIVEVTLTARVNA